MNTLINKDNIQNIIFSDKEITVLTVNGGKYTQELKYYPFLICASSQERENYNISQLGLHWKDLDTDISFDSFFYDFSQPFVFHNIK